MKDFMESLTSATADAALVVANAVEAAERLAAARRAWAELAARAASGNPVSEGEWEGAELEVAASGRLVVRHVAVAKIKAAAIGAMVQAARMEAAGGPDAGEAS